MIIMSNINKTRLVEVIDPDLASPTLVEAWHQGTDKKTGDALVVLVDEPQAVRRVRPEHIQPPKAG